MTNPTTTTATCWRCLGPCPAGTTHCQECLETMKLVEHDFQVMTGASRPLSADDPPYFTDEGETINRLLDPVETLSLQPKSGGEPWTQYFCCAEHRQAFQDARSVPPFAPDAYTFTASMTPASEVNDGALCGYCETYIFGGDEEDGPSERAQEIISALIDGGESASLYVGDGLETIASNGGEMATDLSLAGDAYQMAVAAVGAANDLDPSTQYSVVNRAELRVVREFLDDVSRGNTDYALLEDQARGLAALSCLENV